MKTINVSQAEGPVLDWLVAKAQGMFDYQEPPFGCGVLWKLHEGVVRSAGVPELVFCPSEWWAQGGPIIEREGINLSVDYQDSALSNDMVQIGWKGNLWNNSVPGTAGFLQWAYGPTPLIAAMRCYVASKLGETVEVPKELK